MCDLSDPKILQAYTEIEQYEPTDWMILGYNDTRDVISLYSKGTGGLSEFRNHLSDEVLYGFVRVDDRFILITWVSEQVSGVRRARALVHSRSVAGLLKSHHAQITASSLNDVSDTNIRTRLKLGENQVPNRSRPPSMSERKRSSMQARRRSSQENGRAATPDTDQFVEAYEETPASPVAMDEEEKKKAAAARERALQAAEEERARAEAQAREEAQARAEAEAKQRAEMEAAAAAAAAEEAKRREQEEQEKAKRRAEEEQRRKQEEERQRLATEKLAMQKRIQAEKSKDVLLVGFVSVQPHSSPFWRRRYIVIRGKNLVIYRDELDKTPVAVIDLKTVTRLSPIDHERETYLPNACVLNTQRDGSYQLCADNKKDLSTIMTALQTVIQAK